MCFFHWVLLKSQMHSDVEETEMGSILRECCNLANSNPEALLSCSAANLTLNYHTWKCINEVESIQSLYYKRILEKGGKKKRVKKELTNLGNLCHAWSAPLSEHSTIFAGGDCNVFLFNFPFKSYFKVLAALRPGGLLQVWSSEFKRDPPQGSECPSVCISLQKGGVGKSSAAVWHANQGFCLPLSRAQKIRAGDWMAQMMFKKTGSSGNVTDKGFWREELETLLSCEECGDTANIPATYLDILAILSA